MKSSPIVELLVRRSCAVSNLSFFSLVHNLLPSLLCVIWCFACITASPAQDSAQTPAQSSAQAESKQASEEIATRDEPTTFKVNSKLVVVRAVVRDSQGKAIGSLHQDDFQVFDKGKPQVITQFEVEQPGSLAEKARQVSEKDSSSAAPPEALSATGNAPAAPERFVAYLFDDVHLRFGDLAHVRESAEHHLASLKPTDRAAIFTTSGITTLGFTDDRTKLHEALLRLRPNPISSQTFAHHCPDLSYYQADLIVNKHDPETMQDALLEQQECGPKVAGTPGAGDAFTAQGSPATVLDTLAEAVFSAGDHESRVSLSSLRDVVSSISRMPGQRSIVLVSPGFITPTLEYESADIVDRAVRSQIVINALDARGVYVVLPFGNVEDRVVGPQIRPGESDTKAAVAAATAQSDLLMMLSADTGGIFFHNNNDFDEGFRRVSETPEYTYLLAFVPQNLKLDGSFHALKVTLKNQPKLNLQARRGYYAPKTFADPNEQAKQEIEEAMYSQEELHSLPVQLHTQFYKAGDDDAKLTVLAHVDLQHLHFRKVEGRNSNVLTCVSALFNRNGNFVQGTEKVVTMNLKDDTLQRRLASGITVKTSFDVKPGDYLIRLVVRDSEGQSMSAENGAVEIR